MKKKLIISLTIISIILLLFILFFIYNKKSDNFNKIENIQEKWIWINDLDNVIEVKEIEVNKDNLEILNDVKRK
jgi:heme/copper-type cytochrome/quinol oxidase subunit 2